MISTITLSPSLDTVVVVEDLISGDMNRSKNIFSYPGGKGVDVSRTVRRIGGETCVLGLIAGNNGKMIKRLLDEEDVLHDFITVNGNVRNNLLIENLKEKQETIILHHSDFQCDDDTSDKLKQKVREYAGKSEIMVFSGSVPAAFPSDIYRELIEICHASGSKAVLDSSGESLRIGIEASPFMIKPNGVEFKELTGRYCDSINSISSAFDSLDRYKIPLIVVSLGRNGTVFKYHKEIFKVEPISTEVLSYAGAGDTLVGGIALGIARGVDINEAVSMGTAAATASLSEYGSSFFKLEKYFKYKGMIKIKRI